MVKSVEFEKLFKFYYRMVSLKTEKEIALLCEGGEKLAKVLNALSRACKVGGNAYDLDMLARKLIKQEGARPSFLHYRPSSAAHSFPAAICVSINDTIVHGVPKRSTVFHNGDLVSIDAGLMYKGLYTDSAVTIGLGTLSAQKKKLMRVTRKALELGIHVCKAGNALGDIGYAISSYVYEQGFSLAEDLIGHGVGYAVHESPEVPNIGRRGEGIKLAAGMVLALEPMVVLGTGEVLQKSDSSFVTLDGSLAAHFEHTVAITKSKPITITKE